jgi:hypothetical protein
VGRRRQGRSGWELTQEFIAEQPTTAEEPVRARMQTRPTSSLAINISGLSVHVWPLYGRRGTFRPKARRWRPLVAYCTRPR